MPDYLNADCGLPFLMLSTAFLVFSVLRKHLEPLRLSPHQHAVLSYVRQRGGCPRREVLEQLHISPDDRDTFVSVRMQLIDLSDRDLLDRRLEAEAVYLEITRLGETMLEAAQPLLEDARRELAGKIPPSNALLRSAVHPAV